MTLRRIAVARRPGSHDADRDRGGNRPVARLRVPRARRRARRPHRNAAPISVTTSVSTSSSANAVPMPTMVSRTPSSITACSMAQPPLKMIDGIVHQRRSHSLAACPRNTVGECLGV